MPAAERVMTDRFDMSKLEDVEKQLYGSDEEKLEKRRRRFVLPESLNRPPTSWTGAEEKPVQNNMDPKTKKIIWAALGLIAVVLISGFIFFYLGSRGQEAKVVINGRDRIDSGEVVSLSVSFKNTSSVALLDTDLAIILPSGSKIIESGLEKDAPARILKRVGRMEKGEEQVFEISVRMFGKERENKIVEAVLLYQPEGIRARFSAKTTKDFLIQHVPLAISWEAPETVTQGQEVELKITYSSDAQSPLDNLSFRIDYPPGFSLISSEPKADLANNIWRIGTLNPRQEGKITLRGKINGSPGETKTFKGGLGVLSQPAENWTIYSDSVQDLRIAESPLTVQALAEGNRVYLISPGEVINFSLNYRNNSDLTLKNVSLRVYLESFPSSPSTDTAALDFPPNSGSTLIDLSSLNIDNGGVYDSRDGSIAWGPNTTDGLKELSPGAEGKVGFAVRTKESFPIRTQSDRNLVLRLRTVIDSASVPEELSGTKVSSEDRLDLKTKSKISFSAKSFYRNLAIPNTGPLPPKVGFKTSYTVSYELRNFSNDLNGVEMKSKIPPNVKWENIISPTGVKITYNQSSGEVTWSAGRVPAGTGILGTALTAAFQVSIVPAESDVGNPMTLLGPSTLTGRDEFAGEDVKAEANPVTTELREDTGASPTTWFVVK